MKNSEKLQWPMHLSIPVNEFPELTTVNFAFISRRLSVIFFSPAVRGHACPRCDKVFNRQYNLTRHTVRRHYITPDGNPASEQLRLRYLKASTHNNPAKDVDEATAPALKVK